MPPPRRPLLADHGLLAPRARWRSAIVPPLAAPDAAAAGGRAPARWPGAGLLRRGFAIEVLVGDRCGGRRRILGAVPQPQAVQQVLVALGLAAQPPPERDPAT